MPKQENMNLLPTLDVFDKEKLDELDAGLAVEYLMNKYNCERSDAMLLITGYAVDKYNELLEDPDMKDFLNREVE